VTDLSYRPGAASQAAVGHLFSDQARQSLAPTGLMLACASVHRGLRPAGATRRASVAKAECHLRRDRDRCSYRAAVYFSD
jgi:hypothetical protein